MKDRVRIIDLPKIVDSRGDLTFMQKGTGLPFELKRVFWTYDLKTHSKRGGHAYKSQSEMICVVSGSADLVITYKDKSQERINLNQANKGLFIPSNIWRHIENFATNTIVLHISDSEYDEDEYVRDLNTYFKL